MKKSLRRSVCLFSGLLIALGLAGTAPVRADTVASLLGNFTINQYCGLKLSSQTLDVHYVVVFGQLPALRELHQADADGNGVTSQQERDAYVGTLSPGFADGLKLKVNGQAVPLRATHWTSSLPTEQGGFSLRVDVDFAADLPQGTGDAPASLVFTNENYPGGIGWHEIVVEPAKGLAVYDTNAVSTSFTNGLVEALQSLPADGPLDERSVHLRYRTDALPAGAQGITARASERPVTAPASALANSGNGWESAWITAHTRQLIDAISQPTLEPKVILLALLGALLLGGVHALSPGHGKTIVGAYLIGSRGTPRHAAFLGVTVTITHTLGVFALGFATLYASRFIVPEKLFPILSLVSAVLVLGMGLVLLIQRGRAARAALPAAGRTGVVAQFRVMRPVGHSPGGMRGYVFSPHAPALDPTMHSHGGGPMHSHLPPGATGEAVTWKSLLALGISGGLVPCPSAMVLLLAAVALNKTAYGMLLVVAFSVGLAITLFAVGMAFLYARNRFARPEGGSRWTHILPVLSAATITLLGVALCYGALKTFT